MQGVYSFSLSKCRIAGIILITSPSSTFTPSLQLLTVTISYFNPIIHTPHHPLDTIFFTPIISLDSHPQRYAHRINTSITTYYKGSGRFISHKLYPQGSPYPLYYDHNNKHNHDHKHKHNHGHINTTINTTTTTRTITIAANINRSRTININITTTITLNLSETKTSTIHITTIHKLPPYARYHNRLLNITLHPLCHIILTLREHT